jgi:hypothetical protein
MIPPHGLSLWMHRVRQGLRALFAFSQPVDDALAAEYLSPQLLALFKRMRRSEQIHSLHVLRAVLAQGPTPSDLAVAALLHDVGKSRYPLAVWQKTLAVLVHTFAPALFKRWSAGDPRRFWLRPFVVYAHHASWSAELMAEAGASETAVWLAAHHPEHINEHASIQLLKRLQVADDTN